MRIVVNAVLVLLVNGLLAWLINLPQDVGQDIPQGKLNSMSFAPFREGQDPSKQKFPTPAQIEEDLKLMGQKTHTIRTYSSSEFTMPVIPELAGKYGLTMIQGAWLDPEKDKNKLEIEALIKSANAHPDVVKRVMVGNEVLLRKDLPADELIKYIREVKSRIKQPVSYADVWSMYMHNPELIKEVDFITIHILPYWEDEPIAAKDAPAHIERIYKLVRKEADAIAPGKPILIGETGWPSDGRQRGNAKPSVVNSAKFMRGFIKVAADNGFDYNIVEAFNQAWKSKFEGVVGANWGLYSLDRTEVFPLVGKVYEDPCWLHKFLASAGLFLLALVFIAKRAQVLSIPRLLSLLVLTQVLSVLLVTQATHLWSTSYFDDERIRTVIIVILNALLAGLVLARSIHLLAKQDANATLGAGLYGLYSLSFCWAIYETGQLAVAGRYLSFPTETMSVPIVGLIALMLISYFNGQARELGLRAVLGHAHAKPKQDKWIGRVLILMGIALIIGETYAFAVCRDLIEAHQEMSDRILTSLIYTLSNCQLITWLLSLVVLALPLLLSRDRSAEA